MLLVREKVARAGSYCYIWERGVAADWIERRVGAEPQARSKAEPRDVKK